MVKPQSRRESRDGHYKGVRMRKWGKWVAEVRQPNSRDRIWLGSYETAEEAARAYDAAVFCLRGPSVVLNFPDDPPHILAADELSRSQIQVAASKHARRTTHSSVPEAASAESKQPVVESMFFGEHTELGSSSLGQLLGRESCLAADGRVGGGTDITMDAGGFLSTSRMWNY